MSHNNPSKPKELDPEVVKQALWGEGPAQRTALNQLYEHYEPRVRYAIARAANKMDFRHRADELRQEVWFRLLRRDRRLLRCYREGKGDLGPYISVIAYREALRAARVDRRQGAADPRTEPDEDIEDHTASRFVADLIQSDLYRKLIARAQKELDELDWLVLQEVLINGRRGREVAAEHGIKEQRLYKRKERLSKKLRAWAEELLETQTSEESHPTPLATVVALLMVSLATSNPSSSGPTHDSEAPSSPADEA